MTLLSFIYYYLLNLFVFGSRFRTLAVILFQIFAIRTIHNLQIFQFSQALDRRTI